MWLPEVRQLLQRPTPDTLLAINMDNWVFSSHQANSALFSDFTSSLHLRTSLKGKKEKCNSIQPDAYATLLAHEKMLHTQSC